jgi:hypothetical protein
VSPNVTHADTWIDEELASLRQSIELPGELASTEPRAAPLPRRRARGGPRSGRRTRMPRRTIIGRVRRRLHDRRFDVMVFVAAALSSLALGLLIPLLLQ